MTDERIAGARGMAGEQTWLDHIGNLMTGPASDNPTGYGRYDQLTHRLFRSPPGQLIQALSLCGKRVHEVPGRGDIDCPECLEILDEADKTTALNTDDTV